MRTDADRYADLDTHRTRTNRRADDGSAYDYARAHADQLADANVVPDLDAVADDLADAGPQFDIFPIFVPIASTLSSTRTAAVEHAAPVGDTGHDRSTDHVFVD
jgi:hypothetical protein